MATAKLYNLARVTTATLGTGTLTLGAAVAGALTFADAGVQDGDIVSYGIKDGSNSETGRGTYSSTGPTLARTTVLKSTNGNAAINITSGVAEVFITPLAEDFISRLTDVVGDTSPELGGDLDINGHDIIGTGNIDIAGGTFTINANGVTGPHINVVCDDGVREPDISATGYGAAGGGIFHSKFARGSMASPTQALAGDEVGGYGARPFTSAGSFTPSSPASLHWAVSEDQTATNNGAFLYLLTTPNGSDYAHRKIRLYITHDGTVMAVDEGTHNPRVTRQTKPWADARLLAAGEDASGQTGASVGAVMYGGSSVRTAGFRGATARGTAASPTATQADDTLVYVGGHGYQTTTGGFSVGAVGLIGVKAAENFTSTAQGTYLSFETTPAGSTTRAARARMNDTAFSPATSDGLALGTASLMWSDLFLASGAVINFNNGNATLTHAAGLLTLAGTDVVLNASTGKKFYPYRISSTNNNYITSDASGNFIIGTGLSSPADRLIVDVSGNIVPATAGLAQNATDGFVYIESCAGAPSGTPTAYSNRVPLVYDRTNNKIYAFNGSWKATAALT
jgi:hypothetical protein